MSDARRVQNILNDDKDRLTGKAKAAEEAMKRDKMGEFNVTKDDYGHDQAAAYAKLHGAVNKWQTKNDKGTGNL